MAENERMVKDMERKWEEKLAEAEAKNKVMCFFRISCLISVLSSLKQPITG